MDYQEFAGRIEEAKKLDYRSVRTNCFSFGAYALGMIDAESIINPDDYVGGQEKFMDDNFQTVSGPGPMRALFLRNVRTGEIEHMAVTKSDTHAAHRATSLFEPVTDDLPIRHIMRNYEEYDEYEPVYAVPKGTIDMTKFNVRSRMQVGTQEAHGKSGARL
jgi:hypothetical protein